MKKTEEGVIIWRKIPGLERSFVEETEGRDQWRIESRRSGFGGDGRFCSISMVKKGQIRMRKEFSPSLEQLLKHPLALFSFVPKDFTLFISGLMAEVASKTITAPLNRIKILMQTHGLRAGQENLKMGLGFVEYITMIGREEGIKGFWKGNLPQKLFKDYIGEAEELSISARLWAGALSGMTSTLVTYPYDVLRLRLAVEPGCRTMSKVAGNLLSREGLLGFCSGLGPSLLGIAPYIAVNFYFFDLVKKSLPKEYQNRTESYLATALVSASLATLVCYPLDTVKRQMQMRGSSYKTVYDMVNSCGIIALYRGFIPNALKNLTNSSIRFMTFDTVRSLITASQEERERIMKENLDKWKLQRERRHHEK